jgi:Domain of unknown function (DUF1918)
VGRFQTWLRRANHWTKELAEMKAETGDRVIVESEKVGRPARVGVVEEVLDVQRLRVRVRWEDGHSSVLSPSAGAVRIEAARKA